MSNELLESEEAIQIFEGTIVVNLRPSCQP